MAIYNGGYPATYQNPYLYQYQPAQQQNNGIIWVQGESGAKSYLVAPNSTVQLWDSESQTIYLKSADASGMPSLKVLDYTIRDNLSSKPVPAAYSDSKQSTQYITKDELNALYAQINALKTRVDNLSKEDDHE